MATFEDFILRFKTVGTDSIKAASNAVSNLKDDVADFAQVGGPLGNTLNGIIGKLGPLGIAAGAAATAFAALGGRALQLAGELSDVSGATGIAAGQLMNFSNSVIDAGGKSGDFANIASKLNQSVQEAASGNENLQNSFRTLGVFVTDANGKVRNTGDILQDITTKFQRGEITSNQYSAAIDVLGKNITKLDLTKLSAVPDTFKDEQVAQLDKYNEALDKLAATVNNKLISSFGQLAIAINNALGASDRWAKAEEDANKIGQTYRERTEGFWNEPLFGKEREPLSGQSVVIPERLRDMTEKEKEAYKNREAAAAEHANEMQRLLNRTNTQRAESTAGGFGRTNQG